jgi:rfaE bifunctional protein nucleotidyltransferase chain/domain
MRDEARLKNRPLDELAQIVADLRRRGRKVVHCHGVFDLLHVGHIKHLAAACALGDVLVVTVTPDHWVNKGPHRPAFTAAHRLEALAALSCVDYVALNRWPTAVETIRTLRPDVFVKGRTREAGPRDHTDAIQLEEQAVVEAGGRLVLTEEETFSASTLINRHLDLHPPEVRSFLDQLRCRYSAEQIVEPLRAARDRRILVVGEAIVEEYSFCRATGRSSEDPVLAARLRGRERHAGGVLAVANHLAGFCDRVGVLTALGDDEEGLLAPSVERHRLAGSPAAVRRRFVEETTKLLEVLEVGPDAAGDEARLAGMLEELVPRHDVVVVADHGLGLIDGRAVGYLAREARFLALGGRSSRVAGYPRADLVVVDEADLERAVPVDELTTRIDDARLLLARRSDGISCYERGAAPVEIPTVGGRAVDRVGADAAALALGALGAVKGAPLEVVGFVGSVAMAEASAIIGNRSPIEPATLFRHITSLMS